MYGNNVEGMTLGESKSYMTKLVTPKKAWTHNCTSGQLNPTKCQVMHVYFPRKSTPHVDVYSQKLVIVEKVKLVIV